MCRPLARRLGGRRGSAPLRCPGRCGWAGPSGPGARVSGLGWGGCSCATLYLPLYLRRFGCWAIFRLWGGSSFLAFLGTYMASPQGWWGGQALLDWVWGWLACPELGPWARHSPAAPRALGLRLSSPAAAGWEGRGARAVWWVGGWGNPPHPRLWVCLLNSLPFLLGSCWPGP